MSNNAKSTPITKALLDTIDVPVGTYIVVYSRKQRTAFFYLKRSNDYTLKHTFDKRKGYIRIRPGDYVASIDYDGTLTIGDTFDVFERVLSRK